MKKNILLLNPPGDKLYLRDCYCSTVVKADYYWHPLDLLIQSGIIGEYYNIFVLDANVLRLNTNDALRRISNMDLEVIVFLLSSISWKEDLNFIESIKKIKPAVRLIGSGEVLRFEGLKAMEQFKFIDAILLDFTSNAVLKFMNRGNKEEKIDNFVYRSGNKIVSGEIHNGGDFEYPRPKHEYFPLNDYRLPFGKRRKMASILSSYGCPYKCAFCNTGTLGFKKRKVDNFIDELRYIVSLGINKIFIRDATFGADNKHARMICENIIKMNIKIEWNCFSRIDVLDTSLLSLMKKTGCYLIQFGIESGEESILKRYNKYLDINRILEMFENCRRYKIDTVAHFILGLPGENKNSISKTLNFAKKLNPTYASFNIAEPRFGSRFRQELIEDTQINLFSEKKCFTREEIVALQKVFIRKFYLRPVYIYQSLLNLHGIDNIIMLIKNAFFIFR